MFIKQYSIFSVHEITVSDRWDSREHIVTIEKDECLTFAMKFMAEMQISELLKGDNMVHGQIGYSIKEIYKPAK